MIRTIFLVVAWFFAMTLPLLAQGQWSYYNDFSGGLNLTNESTQLEDNEALVLRNAVIVGTHLEKRGGFTQLKTTFESLYGGITDLYLYHNAETHKRQVIAICAKLPYYLKLDETDDGFTPMGTIETHMVNATNGEQKITFNAGEGDADAYDSLGFIGWTAILDGTRYIVQKFTYGGADVDTMYLVTSFADTTGYYSLEMAPLIFGDDVSFEIWRASLYMADGFSQMKRWTAESWTTQTRPEAWVKLDSFKVTDWGCVEPTENKWYMTVDNGTMSMEWTDVLNYYSADYCVLLKFTSDTLYKPIEIAYVDVGASKIHVTGIDTALAACADDTFLDQAEYQFITRPADDEWASGYTVVDSGSFTSLEYLQRTGNSYYDIIEYGDNTADFDTANWDNGSYYITFESPDTGTIWHYFWMPNLDSDTALRVVSSNAYSTVRQNRFGVDTSDCCKVDTLLPVDYWIVRAYYRPVDYTFPACRYVMQQGNVLWAAGFSDVANRIDLSEVNTDEEWDPSNAFVVHGYDGDEITGMFDIYNYAYCLKSAGIIQLTGNHIDNMAQSPTVYSFGLRSPNSLFRHRNSCVGFNQDMFFVFDGSEPSELSFKIRSVVQDSINRTHYKKINGVDAGTFLAFAMPFTSSAVNNRFYVLDVATGAWGEWTGIRAGAVNVIKSITGPDTLIYASADSGAVFTYGGYDDAVDLEFISPFYDAGDPSLIKIINKYHIQAAFDFGDTIVATIYTDASLSDTVRQDTLTSATPASRVHDYIVECRGNVRGVKYALGIKSLSVDTCRITQFGFNVSMTRERRP